MEWLLGAIGLVLLGIGGRWWLRHQRERFILGYRFHAAIEKGLAEAQPHLTEAQRAEVLATLRRYFLLCARSKQMVAMPSQVVDDAWHAFILYTRAYEQFCKRAFGHFLHHTPAEAYPDTLSGLELMRHTWRLACQQEGMNPIKPSRLPQLFAIDQQLAIPNGYRYLLDCTGQRQDAQGNKQFCAAALLRSPPRLSTSRGGGAGGGGNAGDSSCGGGCGGGCGGD